MPDHTNEPSRLELYKAGKLEERRTIRTHIAPTVEAEAAEPGNTSGLRPEVIALGILVIVLLIVTAIAL
jgi:hypothetical protein